MRYLAAFLATLLASPLSATTYYVSPTGNDSNNGTSMSTPFQTIYHCTISEVAGDTCYLLTGNYIWGGAGTQTTIVEFGSAGTSGNPITLAGYPSAKAVLSGIPQYGVFVELNQDWVTLSNFTITNMDISTGAAINATNAHDTVSNLTLTNNWGLSLPSSASTFVLVTNTASYFSLLNSYLNGTGSVQCVSSSDTEATCDGQGDCVYIDGTNHVLISGDYFGNCGHAALDSVESGGVYPQYVIVQDSTIANAYAGGIYIHNGTTDALLQRNRIFNIGQMSQYGKSCMELAAVRIIARNNVCAFTAYSGSPAPWGGQNNNGTKAAALNDPSSPTYNIAEYDRYYNNTHYKNGGIALNWVVRNDPTQALLTNNVFRNNIFYHDNLGGPPPYITGTPDLYVDTSQITNGPDWTFPNNNTFDHNSLLPGSGTTGTNMFVWICSPTYGSCGSGSEYWTVPGIDSAFSSYFYGNVEYNPAFTDPDNSLNFTLQSSSPVRGIGAHLTTTTASGTTTTSVPVADTYWFSSGYGMIAGDTIVIGGTTTTVIQSISQGTPGTLTVSPAVSFASGASVDIPQILPTGYGSGTVPDLGAYPFGTQFNVQRTFIHH